ncbi:uncharacterized protein LOC34622234 [Cyclospora cayetanensis]|uniref:Phosphatidylcholine transfer protein n=1 Tax=Cyclospora cayetanensis TaxID=88456 RepID=A0A6P6RUE9_9EIME|nr:uncharacterized protein LOC34622234 [Cyclospora cayetanensis]
MAWGPIVMALGFVFGGLAGFALSLANDMGRIRRRQSAAKNQRRRIDNLMRWANYHFATSQSQLQLIFKVVMEYQEAEKEQNAILCADASKQVQRHVMKGGDLESQSKNQTSEDELSGEEGEYSSFDSELLELTKVLGSWVGGQQPSFRKEEAGWLPPEVDSTIFAGLRESVGVRVAPHRSTCRFFFEEAVPPFALLSINSGDLKPNSEFNVALPPDTSLEGYRSATLRQTPAPPSKSVRSAALPEAPKAIGASVPPPGHDLFTHDFFCTCLIPSSVLLGPARLFKSYEDLVNFDTRLKHQTPIGSYEMQFLEEKEPHDSSDPMWELTVDQATIKVYKYNSPDSPVVMVKAYATLEGIPVKVLCHHIRHIPTRLKWDTTFGDYRVVEQDVDGCEMIYCLMKAPFPVSNRDFLQWRRTEEDPEAKVTKMLMRSADHPSVPEKSGVVRAETLISGYIMAAQPNDASSSTLFILAQTDVKGLIPKWVVNTTAARAPVGWVDSLKKACKAYIKQYGDFVPPYNPIA